MLCFSTVSNLKLRKYFGKIKTVFEEIDPQQLQILKIRRIIDGVGLKISRQKYFL